jgi:serine/threonine protein kinase
MENFLSCCALLTRRFRALWCALALLFLSGCPRSEPPLTHWILVAPGLSPTPLNLPSHVDRLLAPEPQTYHLRATVALAPAEQGVACTLVLPHLWAPVVLRVDGRLTDPPAHPVETARRGVHAFRLSAEDTRAPQIELDLEVRHEWSQSGWLDTPPYLSRAPEGGARLQLLRIMVDYGNIAGATAALAISFAYGVLLLLGRRTTGHGWFAVQGGGAAIYCLFCAGGAHALFGRFAPAAVLFGVILMLYASIHFTRAQFQVPPAERFWDGALAVAAVVAITCSGPFAGVPLAWMTVAMVALGGCNQLFVVGRLAFRPDRPPTSAIFLFLFSWILVLSFAAGDCVAWMGLGEWFGGVRVAPIGIGGFALLQSIALSRDFADALKEADRLNVALGGELAHVATQQATVEALNEELRRQVLARSEALSDALTRLASAQGDQVVFQEGDTIEERYRVVRAIGAGGMGVVYEVRRTSDDARFALKVLSGAPGVRELARFAREAKLVAELNHPNVVRVYDAAVAKRGFLFILLEYVDGVPLNRRRDRYGDVSWALRVVHGLARGLEAVHARGIVHRDLKPANVLVTVDGNDAPREIKIVDFGISNTSTTAPGDSSDRVTLPRSPQPADDTPTLEARDGPAEAPRTNNELTTVPARPPQGIARVRSEPPNHRRRSDPGRLTLTGQFLGTPAYMAPELIRDPRAPAISSDLYSLGVVAFELLRARRPFNELEALAQAHGLGDSAVPPSFVGAAIDEALAKLLDATLSTDPARRPTATQIADAVERELEATARALGA